MVVQVQLVEFNPDKLDESVLWTQSKDLGDGFHAVRMVNKIKLNLDAWNGDKDHGGVRDGTTVLFWIGLRKIIRGGRLPLFVSFSPNDDHSFSCGRKLNAAK